MIKIDLADSYYRVPLSTRRALWLAVILLGQATQDCLISVPIMLLMGWVDSPPYFCMCTKTIADTMNLQMEDHHPTQSHLHPQEEKADCLKDAQHNS